MSKEKKYYALSTVVEDWADDNNLRHLFHKGLKWAIRGLKRIRMDIQQHPRTCLLNVSERKTVLLPDGYIDWVVVAIKHGQYAVTLSVNDELHGLARNNNDDTVRGLLSQNLPNGTNFAAYSGYNLVNFTGGNSLFSVGTGFAAKGSFKVIDNGSVKQMYLDYDYPFKQIYLEYITDGIDDCEEHFCHPYEYEYLLAYMDMMYEKKNNPKATLGSRQEAELTLEAEERRLRGRYNDLSPKDILDMSRQEARMTTKL